MDKLTKKVAIKRYARSSAFSHNNHYMLNAYAASIVEAYFFEGTDITAYEDFLWAVRCLVSYDVYGWIECYFNQMEDEDEVFVDEDIYEEEGDIYE